MNPEMPKGGPRRQATVLESVEEIRAQFRGAPPRVGEEPPAPPRAATAAEGVDDTVPFRPRMRPPMALLVALDDVDDSGETIRVRGDTFVIGRVGGDLVIPHDQGMSGRHAEIARRAEGGEFCWTLRDLNSTNGTFVRTSNVYLQPDQELLIGGRRLRFEVPEPGPERGAPAPQANATSKWEALPRGTPAAPNPPALVDISPGRPNQRFPLRVPDLWIGRDPGQSSIVLDEPTIDRRHARVHRDEKSGRWVVTNHRSRNGVWARIQEVNLGRGAYFQCGEQRFLLKAL